MTVRFAECFQSVQGEGPHTGEFTTFVRFSGCDLRCSGWGLEVTLPSGEVVHGCDSPFTTFPELTKNNPKLKIQEVYEKIPTWPLNICITGGEPLLQNTEDMQWLISELIDRGHTIDIFTNGTIPLDQKLPLFFSEDISGSDMLDYQVRYRSAITVCMDFKLPGSGEYGKFKEQNYHLLGRRDELKFVIKDAEDYEVAREEYYTRGRYAPYRTSFGVAFGRLEPITLIQWILRDGLNVHLNLQIQSILNFDEAEREWRA